MAENKHSRVTENEKKRRKKKVKRNRFLAKLAIVCLVIGVVVFAAERFVAGMFGTGEAIKEDIRTAEELQDKVVNILVAGIDWNEDRTSMNTDVIMYVSCDVENKKVSAFQIPRDTYIGTDVSGNGKINSVYSHGDNENRIMNLVEVVNDKLGLPVDHYVTLDMESFIGIVYEFEGGFNMYVPYPVYNLDENGKRVYIFEEPGWYIMTGEVAEQVVRNRNYDNADVQRLEVQSYFYASVVKYFMENLNTSDFIKIMNRFTQYITTDMHWTRIASLAQFGFTVAYEDMYIIKPPLHGYDIIKTGNTLPTNMLICEGEEWARLLNDYCRPHQEDMSASELGIPTQPPAGEIVRDHGVTQPSIQTIADILGNTQEQ